MKHSVFGNVGTLASFRVGSIDARELAEEFSPTFTKEDLEHTENYHAYLKLMIDGKRSTPFSAETLPPLAHQGDEAQKETLIRVSRERFASKREDMTEKIEKWFSK